MTVNLKPALLFASLFVLYTEIDINASRLFSPFGIPAFSNVYFIGWESILLFFAVSIGLYSKSYVLGLGFLLLARCGVEDLLYYLLQLKWPPAQLPWLYTWLPTYAVATPQSLIIAAAYGIGGIILLEAMKALRLRQRTLRFESFGWRTSSEDGR